MRKLIPLLAFLFVVDCANAQLSVGAGYNYTLYREAFQRNVPGLHLRIEYLARGRMGVFLSHTLGFPITEGSMIVANNPNETIRVNSEITYKFKTYNLGWHIGLVGDDETKASLYISPSFQVVTAEWNEQAIEAYDQEKYPYISESSSDIDTGLFGNISLGASYKLGRIILFGEAGYASPFGKNSVEWATNIPKHFLVNTGVKLNLTR